MEFADKILKSSAVFTGYEAKPFAGGVAIKGNKILDVLKGDEIDRYRSQETKVYAYGDKLIMPGFVDAHDHLWWGAVADSDHMVDLTSSVSEEDAIEKIKQYARKHPHEKRIRGFGWYPANWNDAPLPTKISLDEAVPDRPAYMNCADAHTGWFNSLALAESGYSADMDLGAGYLGTFENGELNGLVYEPDALAIGWEKMYAFPPDQIKSIVSNFMKGLAKQGVTSLSEMSADDYKDLFHDRYQVFKEMDERGELTSRVHVYTKFMGYTDFQTAGAWKQEFCSDKFRISGLKGFLDGVTSTYTGLLLQPYADRPDTCGDGVPLASQEELNASVAAGNGAGLPVRIHALGDGAVRMALDAFEESIRVNGNHGLVNTIEHIETIDAADLSRFKELGVVASMQGEHLSLEHNEKITRLGKDRCRLEWPFRSLLDAGADLAFGTDFPVVYYNQLPGIWAAVTRKNYDGTLAGVENGETITLAEALTANTLGAAKVYNRDHELGTLEPGKLADVIVLDRNLFEVPEDEIREAKVILTMMDGKITHEA
ncbi:amidohydrolase [Ihubacter massiliensis]|uniref:Amidohydrolase n=1 Tax=Hominibacterium faecale TaxID=2839743 RepID=A0A9J6QRP4_9FIRM|nr:amidohydrolase [Hominibacterium faecale]MCO7123828.1 amidohydrolase [Ihubacter massiliensis]MCU7378754.1 amidohydrolase [Hominibacterium faecale]